MDLPTLVLTKILSVLVVGGQVLTALLLLGLFTNAERRPGALGKIMKTIAAHALPGAFVVAMVATLGSLYYSEMAGFAVCKLCWFQRIAMYPQALILGIALAMKDRGVGKYTIGLSLAGIPVALFHYWIQMTDSSILPCSVEGLTPSCSVRYFTEFGYITFPLMAATAFLMILAFFFVERRVAASREPVSQA